MRGVKCGKCAVVSDLAAICLKSGHWASSRTPTIFCGLTNRFSHFHHVRPCTGSSCSSVQEVRPSRRIRRYGSSEPGHYGLGEKGEHRETNERGSRRRRSDGVAGRLSWRGSVRGRWSRRG